MQTNLQKFIATMKHPVKFRMFLFSQLPSAFFSGLRLIDIDGQSCQVSVPYKWFSRNPFRSTYFACLAMAAEMTTGALGLAHSFKNKPAISMLVTGIEGSFVKKATGITTFICEEGGHIRQTISDAIASGEGKVIRVKSTGRNDSGETVAEFFVTWSFKAKSSRVAG